MGSTDDGLLRLQPVDRAELRAWFGANVDTDVRAVRLVLARQATGIPSVTYDEVVDECLCFGWIDSTVRRIDADRFELHVARRKPSSVWSAINKAKVDVLVAEGRMTPAGQACIDVAKANGQWTILDGPERGEVPDDLAAALDAAAGARDVWEAWPASVRKVCLSQLALAKRPETRAKRVDVVLAAIAEGTRPFGMG